MSAKEPVATYATGNQKVMVLDGRTMGALKADNQQQFLVIPVKNKTGSRLSLNLPEENNLEEKINKFLASLGLKNTVAKIGVQQADDRATDNPSAVDIFEGFEDYRAKNRAREATLRSHILADTEWLDASQLSERVGFENKNRSAGPNTWKRRNKIFAISNKGKNLYPRYCLDDAWQPLPVVKAILDIFDNCKSGWSLAYWFGTPNSWLNGEKPKDRLATDSKAVIKAATAEKEGLQHG